MNMLKKTDRRLRVGSGQGPDKSSGVGTSRGQEEECKGQAGPQSFPEWPAAPPPKASGFQPPGMEDKEPFPP